jgi:cell division protein FtsX
LHYKGSIVGFSDRLNTILVPQSFIEQTNCELAPGDSAQPSRLIVEVKNPTDAAIAAYFQQRHYQTEGSSLDAGKTAYFLRLLTGIVTGVGVLISLLSFYILMLSIFLLLQKNSEKIEYLLLLGYRPAQTALPYVLLTVGLNLGVLLLSFALAAVLRGYYLGLLRSLFPQLSPSFPLPAMWVGAALCVLVSLLTLFFIRRKIRL